MLAKGKLTESTIDTCFNAIIDDIMAIDEKMFEAVVDSRQK